ncbi:unnamed protein product [Moneuplotes crassus]|uniref:Uncharacterized protein n=1 Tax=Euplotes crassus TaxID=5936 RepID=A0AAD1ULM4_EUPCR|nr:unnamed protein product [Moneuplotes crassus]
MNQNKSLWKDMVNHNAGSHIEMMNEAKPLDTLVSKASDVSSLLQRVLQNYCRSDLLHKRQKPIVQNHAQLVQAWTEAQQDGKLDIIPPVKQDENICCITSQKQTAGPDAGIIDHYHQTRISKFDMDTPENEMMGETANALVKAWNIKIDNIIKNKDLDYASLYPDLSNHKNSKINLNDTNLILERNSQNCPKVLQTSNSSNTLKKMQRFYQAIYVKAKRGLPKGMKSKKLILKSMCEKLRKTSLLSEVSTDDLLFHLCSIIYPSKTYIKNRAIFTPSQGCMETKAEVRAKRAITDFQNSLMNFSPEKFNELLNHTTFEKLYIFFMENLTMAKEKSESKDTQTEKTLAALTYKISAV